MESESSEQGSEGESKHSAEQSQQERAPIRPTDPTQSENTTHPPRNKPKARCWCDKRWRHPQVIVNGALAFVAVIAAIIYYCQLQQMEQALKLDQRAWVAPVVFEGHPEAGKPFNGRVKIRNTGKTFATNVILLTNYCGLPKGSADPDFKNLIESDTKKRHGGVLAPNADVGTDVKVLDGNILTEEDVKRIDNGDYAIILFGRVSYNDIFNCQHWTTFCFRYEKGDPQPFWYGYGNYNEADKNTCP